LIFGEQHYQWRTRRGGGGSPPGLKNSGQTLFSGQAQVAKNPEDKKYFNTVKKFRATLFFRASASCSKLLMIKNQ